jgi:hypothetical protein
VAVVLANCLFAGMSGNVHAEPPPISAEARAVFDQAKDKLLQIRVIHKATRARNSTGTGFVATADGLVLTNYHVVSKLALEPQSYELEIERTDRSGATARLVAVDVGSDLAVLSMDGAGQGFLPMRPTPLEKGERGFALGHPLDLGLTIVEGTYNGLIETEFVQRIHYTGALNAGMSGGPALARDGRVFGINVARRLDGQLVSFLVPQDRAAALLRRAAAQGGAPADFRKEVAAQLHAEQRRLLERFLAAPIGTTTIGRYTVPDARAPFVRCAGYPEEEPKRLYALDTLTCRANSDLFADDGLFPGRLRFTHERYESRGLGPVRFAALVEHAYGKDPTIFELFPNDKELTEFRCHDDFVSRPAGTLRVALCSRAYKSFPGLYDFRLRAVALAGAASALVSTLNLTGVDFRAGTDLAQRFVEAISWTN